MSISSILSSMYEVLVAGNSGSAATYSSKEIPTQIIRSLLRKPGSFPLWYMLTQPAPINWCEEDYAVTPFIAEFWNTISNALFIVSGCIGLYWCHRYHLHRRSVHFVLAALAIIATGITSALFHATIWWIGQRTDEISENIAALLLVHSSYGASVSASATASSSSLSFVLLHSLIVTLGILMVTSILFCELHLISMIVMIIYRYNKYSLALKRIRRRVIMGAVFGLVGFTCWLFDRLACDYVADYVLHAWWHVFMALAFHEVYTCSIVMFGTPKNVINSSQSNGDDERSHPSKKKPAQPQQQLIDVDVDSFCGVSWIVPKKL